MILMVLNFVNSVIFFFSSKMPFISFYVHEPNFIFLIFACQVFEAATAYKKKNQILWVYYSELQ